MKKIAYTILFLFAASILVMGYTAMRARAQVADFIADPVTEIQIDTIADVDAYASSTAIMKFTNLDQAVADTKISTDERMEKLEARVTYLENLVFKMSRQ